MADTPYNMPSDDAGGSAGVQDQAAIAALGARAAAAARPDVQAGAGSPAPQLSEEAMNTFDPQAQAQAHADQSWGTRTVHGILSALGGKFETQYIPTPNGVVQQQIASTPGQQWKRIIAGALTGFGAAATAGTQGPGGAIRGAGAGIQAGYQGRIAEDKRQQEQANTQFSQDQEAAMNTARKSMMASEITKNAFELSQAQKVAHEGDLAAEASARKMYEDAKPDGAVDLGVMPNFQALVDKFNSNPALHDQHAQGQLVPVMHVNAGNVVDGVQGYWIPKNYQDRKVDIDTTMRIPIEWDDKQNPTKYQDVTFGKSTGLTGSQYQDTLQAMILKLQGVHKDQVDAQTKQAELDLKKAAQPAELEKLRADAAEARSHAAYFEGKVPQFGNPIAESMWVDPQHAPAQNFPSGTPGINVAQIGKVPTHIAEKEEFAQAVLDNTAEAVGIIARRPDLFGKVAGREDKFAKALGSKDPDLARLYVLGGNISRPSVSIHGAKGISSVLNDEENLFNGLKNSPEATLAALLQNAKSARTFTNTALNYRLYGDPHGPNQSLALRPGTTPAAPPGGGTNPPAGAGVPVQVQIPGGSPKWFPNQAAADNFKRDAGIK